MTTKQYLDYQGLETLVENINDKYATKDDLAGAGKVKTVNGIAPDANGNIKITIGENSGGGHVIVSELPSVEDMEDGVVYYVPEEAQEYINANEVDY